MIGSRARGSTDAFLLDKESRQTSSAAPMKANMQMGNSAVKEKKYFQMVHDLKASSRKTNGGREAAKIERRGKI